MQNKTNIFELNVVELFIINKIKQSPLQVSSEEDIFNYIGMEYKKPEERNM
jgi:DNA polymerase/3'-5' exonuclease PolX